MRLVRGTLLASVLVVSGCNIFQMDPITSKEQHVVDQGLAQLRDMGFINPQVLTEDSGRLLRRTEKSTHQWQQPPVRPLADSLYFGVTAGKCGFIIYRSPEGSLYWNKEGLSSKLATSDLILSANDLLRAGEVPQEGCPARATDRAFMTR